MAITVYTYNDKVLKNVATDKWLKKPESHATLIYSDTTAYETASGNGIQYNVDFSDYTYTLLQIAIKTGGQGIGNDMNIALEFNNADWDDPNDMNCVWKFQLDSNTRSYQPIRIVSGPSAQTQGVTTFTKDPMASVTSRNISGNQLTIWRSYTGSSDYSVHSLLINTSTNIATHYLNGSISGTGNLVTAGKFNYLAKYFGGSMYLCHKDLYVYGSNTEQDLINIIQGN